MHRSHRSFLFAAAALAFLGAPALPAAAVDFDGRTGRKPSLPKAEAPTAPGEGIDQDERVWVVFPAANRAERTKIAEAGVSIEQIEGDTVSGIATPEALKRLAEQGIRPTQKRRLHEFHLEGYPGGDEAYFDYAEVQSNLQGVAAAHPELVSLISIGSSLEGRRLTGVRFNTTAKGDAPSDKPGIVFLGTHHAREHLSTMVPSLLAKWLGDNKEKPAVKKLLETRDIYVIPLVNPDGAEFDISSGRYKMQRKNMRRNPDGSLGVDLNRNYGFHWGEGGASSDPGSETFRGPRAFSEPETSAVKAFVEARPNVKILLTYHTFSELILYPWGHTYDPIGDGRALNAYKAMAGKMAEWTGYTPEQSSDLYIASGDTTDWAWGAKKVFSFTFELTPKSMWSGGFYPGAAAIASTFARNIDPALYLIDLADDPYRAAGGGSARARLKPLPSAGSR